MPWSPPTVVVDSLTLELVEDKLREAAAKMSGALSMHRSGCVLGYLTTQDVRDQIVDVAEQLRKMRDGSQR